MAAWYSRTGDPAVGLASGQAGHGRVAGPDPPDRGAATTSGPRTALELLPVMVARVPHRLGLGRSRSSFLECDQVA